MDNYFVVLELPFSESSLLNNKQNSRFWTSAKDFLKSGSAVIVSSRTDTGICEELKSYLTSVTDFTTFVLLEASLRPSDLINKNMLLPKLASSINVNAPVEVIDSSSKFQVVVQA